MIMDYWSDKALNHHTEATTMLYAARECGRILLQEGLPKAFARHAIASRAVSEGLQAMGLKLFGDQRHKMANVTGVYIPQGVDGEKVRRGLLKDFNIEIGTSFGPLHGRIWRIGTMGYNARADAVLNTLGALEAVLAAEKHQDSARRGGGCRARGVPQRLSVSVPDSLLVAIGGNATHPENIRGTTEEQEVVADQAARALLPLVKSRNRLLITHGNGPVVGKILLRMMLTQATACLRCGWTSAWHTARAASAISSFSRSRMQCAAPASQRQAGAASSLRCRWIRTILRSRRLPSRSARSSRPKRQRGSKQRLGHDGRRRPRLAALRRRRPSRAPVINLHVIEALLKMPGRW